MGVAETKKEIAGNVLAIRRSITFPESIGHNSDYQLKANVAKNASSRALLPNCVAEDSSQFCKMVQQSRMRWRLAPDSKIIGSAHKAKTEMFLPDPVDDDTTRQWI